MKKVIFYALLLTSCSTTPNEPDPHKEFNRDMPNFNLAVDRNVLKPVATMYKGVTPNIVRESISNFLANLKEPFYFLNYIITCDAEHAANSFFRFAINSIFGILGFFDIGKQIGLKQAPTSHKDTLKKFNISSGDYIVLPVFGSSSTRDAIAEPISWFADPVGYFIGFPYMLAKTILSMVDERAENMEFIDSTIQNSLDLYSTTKNMYLQKYGNSNADKVNDAPSPDS